MVDEHPVQCSYEAVRQTGAPNGCPSRWTDLMALLYSGFEVENKRQLYLSGFHATAMHSEGGCRLRWRAFCNHHRLVAYSGGQHDHRPCYRQCSRSQARFTKTAMVCTRRTKPSTFTAVVGASLCAECWEVALLGVGSKPDGAFTPVPSAYSTLGRVKKSKSFVRVRHTTLGSAIAAWMPCSRNPSRAAGG